MADDVDVPALKRKVEIEITRDDPPSIGRCTAPECGRAIEWVTTTKGRKMPIDYPLVPERVHERAPEVGGFVYVIDAARSHFATCPKAKDFSRRK